MKVRNGTLIIGAIIIITASLATAADRCHQNLLGTRSLTLSADVTSYRFAGERIVVEWARSPKCAGTAMWDYASTARAKMSVSCQRPAAQRQVAAADAGLVAWDASRAVRVAAAPASADAPGLFRRRRPGDERARGVVAVVRAPCPDRGSRRHRDSLRGVKRHGIYAPRCLGRPDCAHRCGPRRRSAADRPGRRALPGRRGPHEAPHGACRANAQARAALSSAAGTGSTVHDGPHVHGELARGDRAPDWSRLAHGETAGSAARAHTSMRGGAGQPPVSTSEISSISMDGPRVAIAIRVPGRPV